MMWCGLLLKHLASSVNPTTGHTDHPSPISPSRAIAEPASRLPILLAISTLDVDRHLHGLRAVSTQTVSLHPIETPLVASSRGVIYALHQYLRYPALVTPSSSDLPRALVA
ncbi:hypothetical protein CGRA01v4_10402 [Colletotrichum graminicola]|nr:hypothetical protein CGRA01v4_10402 [Colletotrichum graminicola]